MKHDAPARAPIDVAVIQFKPAKGDIAANVGTLQTIFAQLAAARSPRLIVLPEACLTGYFLEGAVYELALTAATFAQMLHAAWVAAAGPHAPVDIVCGFFENDGGTLYNSALYATVGGSGGPVVAHVHRKMFLATYGVFDEERFLSRGRHLGVFESALGTAALLICEDAWHAIMPTVAALKGARVLFIPSASPGRGLRGNGELESVLRWKSLLRAYASEHGVYIIYAGLTGFEGGKGLAGSTCIVAPNGSFVVEAPALDACIVRAALDPAEIEVARATLPLLGDLAAVLPDLWYDSELPLPRYAAEAS